MAGNYSVEAMLKPLQAGQVWSMPIAKCFEKCSTAQCFMTLNLYNANNSSKDCNKDNTIN